MRGVVYDTADDPQEALAIAEHFHSEWYNGGLSQFFANWEPGDAAFVPTALRNIGFPQGAIIVDNAIAVIGPQTAWRDTGLRALLDSRSPVAKALYDFDREIGALEKPFDDAIAAFERGLADETDEESFD